MWHRFSFLLWHFLSKNMFLPWLTIVRNTQIPNHIIANNIWWGWQWWREKCAKNLISENGNEGWRAGSYWVHKPTFTAGNFLQIYHLVVLVHSNYLFSPICLESCLFQIWICAKQPRWLNRRNTCKPKWPLVKAKVAEKVYNCTYYLQIWMDSGPKLMSPYQVIALLGNLSTRNVGHVKLVGTKVTQMINLTNWIMRESLKYFWNMSVAWHQTTSKGIIQPILNTF